MYTRNFGKQKYTPPPGYDGTAFNGTISTKHHEPTELIRLPEEKVSDMPSEPIIEENIVQKGEVQDAEETIPQKKPMRDETQWKQLLEMVRGKLGTEELIILLVMLLIASEGFSAEMLILGILLVI